MNTAAENRPIRPDLVARKLESVRNFEHEDVVAELTEEPRLAEILWFLQWASNGENYPGGLRKFARDLIAESADLIGPATPQNSNGPWDEEECRHVLLPIPDLILRHLDLCLPSQRPYRREREAIRASNAAILQKRRKTTRADLLPECADAAEENLADYLRRLCEGTAICFRRKWGKSYEDREAQAPWYFAHVADAILRFMDRRKEAVAAEIAETAVSREIFRWLGLAVRARDSVIIEGNSRFGKTEAIRAWCRMNPGLTRLVETPSSNSESDLLIAVAKSLGVEVKPRQRGFDVRPMIEYVLKHSGLFLVFEEAHFLYPSKLSKNTPPARLNWVRRSVMDAGLPVAFICTPQSLQSAQARFVKATGYPIEQLEGRFLPPIRLPETVPVEDLLAIARKRLPGVQDVALRGIAELLAGSERNYCSDVARIARLAFIYAEDAGRATPSMKDIKAAIGEALPKAEPGAAVAVAGAETALPLKAPIHPSFKRREGGLNEPCKTLPLSPGRRRPALSSEPDFEPVPRVDSLVIPSA